MDLDELRELERYTMPTYARAGVEFVRGEGCRLWDSEGKEYLDFFAGLSVHNAGHCHPRIVEAIRAQAAEFAGSSNLFLSEPALRLAERVSTSSLGGKVFLANSGAEANECAIKLARKRAHARGIGRPEIVSLDGGFHGRTIATLAATPRLADEATFGPLPQGYVHVPRDDAAALGAAVTESTAAILIEPIQGEAGIFPIESAVLLAAREACDRSGALLIFDEIQTGMGRTGSLWAYEQLGVRPDLLTTGKALGGGLPVAACIAGPGVEPLLEAGEHGSTFAGGPIGAVAALAALEVIDDPELLREVRACGSRLIERLGRLDAVDEVRGCGLMIGLTLAGGVDAQTVRDAALDDGLVLNCPGPSMLRLLPPLVIGEQEVARGLEILTEALAQAA